MVFNIRFHTINATACLDTKLIFFFFSSNIAAASTTTEASGYNNLFEQCYLENSTSTKGIRVLQLMQIFKF